MRHRGSFLWGMIILAVGIVMLLIQLDVLALEWSTAWPLLILGLSLVFHVSYFASSRTDPGVLVPGGILLVYGGLFFATANYSGATYGQLWPLFILGPAVGLLEMYLLAPAGRRDRGSLHAAAILTIIGGAFLLRNLLGLNYQILVPIAIMAIGGYIILRSMFKHSGTHVQSSDD